jgi:large subunit ribosomal protein L9
MEVILLERIGRLGKMGDVIRVRDGYGRNFLLPSGKALRANSANKARFEREREHLETRNQEQKAEAQIIAEALGGKTFVLIRQAGETGQLYGSVSARDIADLLNENSYKVGRQQISLNSPLKTIGIHSLNVSLHPEIEVTISINIARNSQEAERQGVGEDLTLRQAEPRFDTFVPEEGHED